MIKDCLGGEVNFNIYLREMSEKKLRKHFFYVHIKSDILDLANCVHSCFASDIEFIASRKVPRMVVGVVTCGFRLRT